MRLEVIVINLITKQLHFLQIMIFLLLILILLPNVVMAQHDNDSSEKGKALYKVQYLFRKVGSAFHYYYVGKVIQARFRFEGKTIYNDMNKENAINAALYFTAKYLSNNQLNNNFKSFIIYNDMDQVIYDTPLDKPKVLETKTNFIISYFVLPFKNNDGIFKVSDFVEKYKQYDEWDF